MNNIKKTKLPTIGNKKIYADAIVDFLLEKKVKKVFDLTGGMIAYIEDAISRADGIECFPVHHEQAGGFASEAYSRVISKNGQSFGISMATGGPGATNMVTAVGSSYFDSVPTMFIVGSVHTDNIKKLNEIRQEGFQETDIAAVVKPISKYSVLITDPDRLIYELEKAHYIMYSGRPGSVLLSIPINLQRTFVPENVAHFIGSPEHRRMEKEVDRLFRKPSIAKINKLKQLLDVSKAPLVIVGNGVRVSNTVEEFTDFVKRNNIPVVSSLLGIDTLEECDFDLGMIGSNGNREANIAFANADLIIALGTRLDIRQTGDVRFFNKDALVVHVDIDKYIFNYTIKNHLSFEIDLSSFFKATKHIVTNKKDAWFNFLNNVRKNFSRKLKYSNNPNPKHVDPNTFIFELSKSVSSHSIIIPDVGQNQMWCAQSWKVKKGQRLLFSAGMGAMGFALPAGIGAWCADPRANIIVISGDGGLQINIQEMETVSRNKIPMKLFVLNNKSLGMVREFQDLYFNKNHQSTIIGYGHPDFKKISDAYGFDYKKITKIEEEDTKIRSILESKRPTLIEVSIDINANLQPKIEYGHALDDQSPYLNQSQRKILEDLKSELKSS